MPVRSTGAADAQRARPRPWRPPTRHRPRARKSSPGGLRLGDHLVAARRRSSRRRSPGAAPAAGLRLRGSPPAPPRRTRPGCRGCGASSPSVHRPSAMGSPARWTMRGLAVEELRPSPRRGPAVPLDGARVRRQGPTLEGSRVSTTTSCPAPPSSRATAPPMSPDPPVITIRMAVLPSAEMLNRREPRRADGMPLAERFPAP